MEYPTKNIRFKYYGKNVESLMEKALTIDHAEEQESAIIHIARLMKSLYSDWNKNSINEETLIQHIRTLSGEKITLDLEKVRKYDLFDMARKERSNYRRSGSSYHSRDRGDRGDRDTRRGGGRSQGRQNRQQNRTKT